MCTNRNNSGFTLIEIIVVLVLVSLIASMVGPQLFNRIEKMKVSVEKKKFESIFDTAKDTSFCRGTEIFIKLKNNTLTVLDFNKEIIQQTNFKFLKFTPFIVSFNANGFPDMEKIEYLCDQRNEIIFL
ncbi:MAG: prepilin-type N-terminal cleavage/methylation domain-containing protein [Desulfobacteraceae bacterium]|nr:prepilin-type N-terminal cleavage/methylation domain-containing protein [Desulfobacteraceae bacterium]